MDKSIDDGFNMPDNQKRSLAEKLKKAIPNQAQKISRLRLLIPLVGFYLLFTSGSYLYRYYLLQKGTFNISSYSTSLLLKGIITLLLGGLLLVNRFKPNLYFRIIDFINNRFRAKVQPLLLKIVEKVTTWADNFRKASGKARARMLVLPSLVTIIFCFIWFFGGYFRPPKIQVSFPNNSGENVPLDTQIEIQFDREMKKSSVENAFSIEPEIKGGLSWAGDTRLFFTPEKPLELDKKYTVKIGSSAMSKFFVPKLTSTKIIFETLGNPYIILASPQTEAPKDNTAITVMFDRAMIPLTTADEKETFAPAFTIEPEVAGEGRWLGTTAYQFTPSASFKNATTYTYKVAAGMKSEDGGVLQDDTTFSFSTPRPRIVATTPEDNYQYANPIASASATINLPINTKTAKEKLKLFKVQNGSEEEIPASIKFLGRYQVGMHPIKPLEREVEYEARILPGLLSTDGPNGLENEYRWKFKTAPRPRVINSEPQNGAKEIQEQHSIKVEFASPMNEKSFKGNVVISPTPERDPSLYFSSYNDEHYLHIGTYLARSTNYTITITSAVKDQYGVPLGSDYSFSFSTAPYKPSISIIPSGTYFASFNQDVVPRIVVKTVNTQEVKYKLYKLNREDFLNIYKIRYNYGQESNLQKYDPSKHQLVKEWKETFDADSNVPVHVITKVEKSSDQKIDSGFYFLDASIANGSHDNLVMVVAKNTAIFKTSPKQGFVWVVNQSSGEVVSDAKIELVRLGGEVVSQGKTNSDGVFKTDVNVRSERENYANVQNPIFAFTSKDNDISVVADNWLEGIQPYEFGLERYYDYQERDDYRSNENLKMYIVVDRPIYRPGQTVYYKGVVRRDDDGKYSLLEGQNKVSIKVSDSQNRDVFSEEVPLSSYGTFSGSFVISADGGLGYYNIRANVLGNGFSQSFQVEEYKRADFAVEVTTDKPDYVDGDTVKSEVAANFYFGAPLDHRPLTWVLTTQDYSYRWHKDRTYEFGDSDSYWYEPWWGYNDYYSFYGGKKVSEGSGRTDQDGKYAVALPLNISDKKTNQRMRLEAVVEEENNQVIAASYEWNVHQASLHVGIKPVRYSYKSGTEAQVEVVSVGIDGQELKNIPVTVTFYKRVWSYVREKNEDDGEFYWVTKTNDTLVSSTEVVTGEFGRATAAFTPGEGGTYHAVAIAKDFQGRSTTSGTNLWVSGYGRNYPQYNHDRTVIVPDKQEYEIGSEASVVASLPYENTTGLFTVERGSVFDYKVVKTTPESQSATLSIKENYSPNAFVSAVFVKPGTGVKDPPQFKIGVTEIRVNNPKNKINVSVKANKDRYAPGEEAKVELVTKDGTGSPTQTELSVALVDEAVWSLARARLADIYETFYRPRNLDVLTSTDLTRSMDRLNANVNLGSKGGSGGGCFTGDTPVMTDRGPKEIEKIAVGDTVMTRETEDSGTLVTSKVSQVFVHDVDGYFLINDSLEVTGVHRVYTKRGWIAVNDLKKGDRLLSSKDEWVRVNRIEKKEDRARVYNLEIEKYHTYFAGNFWVHNDKDGGPETTREKFLDTAYWSAQIETNPNGVANINIPLPDNLTTWRLIAIAVSKNTSVGDAVSNLLVTKDVLVRPHLPRFLSVGDLPRLGMTVHNNTQSDSSVEVKIKTEGIKVLENESKTVTVAAKGSTDIYWNTQVLDGKEASISLSAKEAAGGFNDEVKIKIPVELYYTPEVVATSGEAKDHAEEKIFLPEEIVPDMGNLDISLSPTLGAGVQDAANFILNYAYWCNEQAISKVMPAVHLLRIAKEADINKVGGRSTDELKNMISYGIQTLVSNQRPGGGWGWWVNHDPDLHLSAMILDGLLDAKENKHQVTDSVIDKAKTYLMGELNRNSGSLEVQSYIAFVLAKAGSQDEGNINRLMDRRWQMNELGRTYLLRAAQEAGSKKQKRLFDEMMSMVIKSNTTAHWELKRRDWSMMSGNITLTSVMLEAMINQNSRHPLVADVTRWLMQARKGSNWNTTRENASAVRAISTMLIDRKEVKINENWQILLEDRVIKEGKFEKTDMLRQVMETLDIDNLEKEKDLAVKIQRSGDGSLYYNMNLKYYLPFEEVEPLDQGIVIIREYVDRNGKILKEEKLKAGDELWVRLILLTASDVHHVIVEDRLPAGLEAVNESLATTSLLNVNRLQVPEDRRPLYFRYYEMRDDRVVLFAETLPKGVYEYTYRVRPTVPGKYHHPPAQAYNMYVPDISGHSWGGWMEVLE